MRIGIDVGRTHTDAVLMAGREIVATSKSATSSNPAANIASAVIPLLQVGHVRPVEIDAVMIGMAPLTRAFEERRGLQRVGVLRLTSPTSGSGAPLSGWPPDLVTALDARIAYLSLRPQRPHDRPMPFDAGELLEAVKSLHRTGILALAISAPGAAQRRYTESEAATHIRAALPDLELSLASDFSDSSGMENENAAIVNAALGSVAERTLRAVRAQLKLLRIAAPVFLSRGDGTLASFAQTRSFPLLTLASDAANSIRGAAHVARVKDAIVIDIGGSSTMLGLLVDGSPSVRSTIVTLAGVRVQLPLPEAMSIDLGGGSVVRPAATGASELPRAGSRPATESFIALGPDCVGTALRTKARVFGGDTLTLTDLAVAAGRMHLGDASLARDIDTRLVRQGLEQFQARIESAAALAGRDGAERPKVLVGGGAQLVARPAAGWAPHALPAYHAVANAIGAATAPLSEQTDSVCSYRAMTREIAIAQACANAMRRLHEAGAVDGTARIVSVEEVLLAGEPGDLARLRIRASGKPPG